MYEIPADCVLRYQRARRYSWLALTLLASRLSTSHWVPKALKSFLGKSLLIRPLLVVVYRPVNVARISSRLTNVTPLSLFFCRMLDAIARRHCSTPLLDTFDTCLGLLLTKMLQLTTSVSERKLSVVSRSQDFRGEKSHLVALARQNKRQRISTCMKEAAIRAECFTSPFFKRSAYIFPYLGPSRTSFSSASLHNFFHHPFSIFLLLFYSSRTLFSTGWCRGTKFFARNFFSLFSFQLDILKFFATRIHG